MPAVLQSVRRRCWVSSREAGLAFTADGEEYEPCAGNVIGLLPATISDSFHAPLM